MRVIPNPTRWRTRRSRMGPPGDLKHRFGDGIGQGAEAFAAAARHQYRDIRFGCGPEDLMEQVEADQFVVPIDNGDLAQGPGLHDIENFGPGGLRGGGDKFLLGKGERALRELVALDQGATRIPIGEGRNQPALAQQ
jgi:hypothetical protein